ncbi:MAG: BREX-1 system adenine-specific DNA-methyltransferase PglX, partial [Lachnospiraceae bacterium]|nr:BREX-1 system adenine-specific DNA-methyltransferase PglX [Lachnospiraceae bacterium]
MDKNAIKKYAVWAREQLIEKVTARAVKYQIVDGQELDGSLEIINGEVLPETERKQRSALIQKIKADGYGQVMEEVAYTWFNRFIALRFMEVNGYLPSHVRVFTDEAGEFKPQIMSEALHLEFKGIDMEKVYELKNDNRDDDLFKYLLITQCNDLSDIFPKMFQRIADYTELLLPDYLLREGSVIEQMVNQKDGIPETDWQDQVQIIGWLYQYYNTEPKDKVFADLKKNVKITKETIPAATQLFTPDWIVHYMVENSLGRLWLEGHPNDTLKGEWKYYLDEAEQEPDVQKQLEEIRKVYAGLKPEEIRCIDPCMGSGHILCVLFDTLIKIYEDYGYPARDAAASIVENNLWGLDIDERAAQLAYFAVMMKARQYDRRFFTRGIQPNVYAIEESNGLKYDGDYGNFLLDKNQQETLSYMFDVFKDAKEYGSILSVEQRDYDSFLNAWKLTAEQTLSDVRMMGWYMYAGDKIFTIANQAKALSQKYHVVVTNPPYMGNNGMDSKLVKFVKKYFNDVKMDLFACFMDKGMHMTKENGFLSMITMESWMFLSSFEILRKDILKNHSIVDLMHMPYLGKGGTSLGINFGTAATVIRCKHIDDYKADYQYVRYYETDDEGIPFKFPVENERRAYAVADDFSQIPGSPVAYWVDENIFNAFRNGINITQYVDTFQGIITGDNNKFLRLWYEPDISHVALDREKIADIDLTNEYWIPYNKGGDFRNWYGNQEYVVYWKNGPDDKTRGKKSFESYYLREYVSWSYITSSTLASRYFPKGFLWDVSGSGIFDKSNMLNYLQCLIGSKVGIEFLKIINPTINYQVENIAQLPVLIGEKEKIDQLACENIEISKFEWDSFEHSWEFKRHPLIPREFGKDELICDLFNEWNNTCDRNFDRIKENEEEINRILINTYHLQSSISPTINDEDVTVRRADLQREIKSLISYAVGCMFGRYSLDVYGLAYAGGIWDDSKYKTFLPDKDAILPICDDEYFEDDIVGRFVQFIEIVYGKATLEENLAYIAEAIGGKGTTREIIRNYFINDFYIDHCQIYSVTGSGRRPIYWLFDSGKKNGFKCLIYMHRYQPDTIARIRTDYVHEQQARYRTAIEEIEKRI